MSELDNAPTPWEEVRATAKFTEHEEAAVLARTLEMRAECLAEFRKQRHH